MGGYWIKLYQEILDDPKMATLPDRLWRRIIELFLIAGRTADSGELPDTKQIAWILRCHADEIALDMEQIQSTGIIERTNTGWFITQFAKRQAPSQPKERKQQQRERDHKSQYYGHDDVTKMSQNVTQIDRLTDNRIDNREEQRAAPKITGKVEWKYDTNGDPINPFTGK